ncbi:hypothetical protein ACFOY4_10140 [Actinomadura syzygii]
MLEEAGIRPVLIDERIGHEDGSVQRRYTHITQAMRDELLQVLTTRWEASLKARRTLSPGSPVAALNELLQPRPQTKEKGRNQDHPTEFPQRVEGVCGACPASIRLVEGVACGPRMVPRSWDMLTFACQRLCCAEAPYLAFAWEWGYLAA